MAKPYTPTPITLRDWPHYLVRPNRGQNGATHEIVHAADTHAEQRDIDEVAEGSRRAPASDTGDGVGQLTMASRNNMPAVIIGGSVLVRRKLRTAKRPPTRNRRD
ncbi:MULTISPECIES: hypothetical protein [unclassified Mesorhizobium]|uniref:hypothetical protein n=1 Tax=unclassified Mesorhizobium TaxID=325217 RepID=UPI001FE0F843|nr:MULTISPECIES: hypothetical protein [unclassified Mesorhizobium]